MDEDVERLAANLSRNLRQLRTARGYTQLQLSSAASVPRATIAKLEAGSPNPTLATIARLAGALRVTIEELIAPPVGSGRLYAGSSLPSRRVGGVELRGLLPHPIPGLTLERMAFAAGSRMKGAPHLPGSREYLACESGRVQLTTPAERWILSPGDVVEYPGDQPHGYTNASDDHPAVAYTVVLPGL